MRDEIGSSPMLNELRPGSDGTGHSEYQVLPRSLRQAALRNPQAASEGSDSWQQQMSLAGQTAVKLGVRRNGWYRVSGAQLQAAGLPANTDVKFLQLYLNNQQVPLAVRTATGGNSGVLGSTGVVEFYGLGNDTRESDTNTYWLITGERHGLRYGAEARAAASGGADVESGSGPTRPDNMKDSKGQLRQPEAATAASSFNYTVERKDRTVYGPAIHNGPETENFFGAIISGGADNQTLQVNRLDTSATAPASLTIALQGATNDAHQVAVSLNGTQIGVMAFNGTENLTTRFTVAPALLTEGENTVTLLALNGSADVSAVDYLRLTYPHRYAAENNSLLFTSGNRNGVTVTGFTTNQVRVFDLTNPLRPFEVNARVNSAGTEFAVTVSGNLNNRQLFAVADNQVLSPVSLTANEPSNWTTPQQVADFLILTPRALRPAGETLAAARRQQGMSTVVVNIEDVYDEWSGGTKDTEATRSFLRYAKTRWATAPRYVLLVGDASYDQRNYLGYGDTDMLPTAMVDTVELETASDEALVDFDNDGIGEMSIGRLPVRTLAQAQAMVARILNYAPFNGGAVMVSDTAQGFDFAGINQTIRPLLPANMAVTTIERGAQPDAATRAQVVQAHNAGPSLMVYAGHGSSTAWSSGPLFDLTDAGNAANGNRLPLVVTLNCLNGYFHTLPNDSLAEGFLKAGNGGAIAVWASSGLTEASGQLPMGRAFFGLVYNNGMRLGDATRQAKAGTNDENVRRTWILFGDPTMQIR